MLSSIFVYVGLGASSDFTVDRGLIFPLLPGILVTFSPTYIDVGIRATLFQIYPTLISTLISMKREQLSLFDANYGLILSSSPLTAYLVFATIGDVFGSKTGLYKRIKHR